MVSLRTFVAGLLAGLVGFSAASVSAAALDDALRVYADGIVMQRAGSLACGGAPKDAAAEQASWQKGKAIFVATLWANAVPAETVRAVEASLGAEPAPDCKDERLLELVGMATDDDWTARIGRVLERLGFTIIAEPPDLTQWSAISTVVAEEAKIAGRFLSCMAVHYPVFLPEEVKDWDDLLVASGQQLVARGFPRDDVVGLLAGAASDRIWTRVSGEAAVALKADCNDDAKWYENWVIYFAPHALRSRLGAIIAPSQ